MAFYKKDLDIGFLENKYPLNIKISLYSEELISNTNILVISHGCEDDIVHKQSYTIIKNAINKVQKIICYLEISEEKLNEIKVLCTNSQTEFVYMPHVIQEKYHKLKLVFDEFYTPKSFIIYICSAIDDADEFDVLLKINMKLQNKNYKVCAIGKSSFYNLFDFYNCEFIFNNKNYDEVEKIKKLNAFIKYIDAVEKPDIIIIHIPGGIIKYNNNLSCSFGVYNYMLNQAVKPDFTIYCTQYIEYIDELFGLLSNHAKNHFDFGIDCVHLSNKKICTQESNMRKEFRYFKVPVELVDETINDNGKEYFLNLINDHDCNFLIDKIFT